MHKIIMVTKALCHTCIIASFSRDSYFRWSDLLNMGLYLCYLIHNKDNFRWDIFKVLISGNIETVISFQTPHVSLSRFEQQFVVFIRPVTGRVVGRSFIGFKWFAYDTNIQLKYSSQFTHDPTIPGTWPHQTRHESLTRMKMYLSPKRSGIDFFRIVLYEFYAHGTYM